MLNFEYFSDFLYHLKNFVWGWPLILYLLGMSIYLTLKLDFVQFRYFFQSFKNLLQPKKVSQSSNEAGEITLSPWQALLNTLGSSIGNGNLAGIAIAIQSGGPGAAFWMFVVGFLGMALRFAEVYLAMMAPSLPGAQNFTHSLTGPMLYLRLLKNGAFLSWLFCFISTVFGIVAGNSMQCNALGTGLHITFGMNPYYTAIILTLFVVYMFLGGSKRIVAINDRLVPFKVLLFLISALGLLGYHAAAIPFAFKQILIGAFHPSSIAGAAIGMTVKHALQIGIVYSINANESGLGTAAIIFSSTESGERFHKSMLSTLGVFVTTHIVCFLVALCVIVSQAWLSQANGLGIVIHAYHSVYGNFAGVLVTFLSVSFAMSTVTAYAFIARKCWIVLTNHKCMWLFPIIYATMTFWGTIQSVKTIWYLLEILNACLLVINLYGLYQFSDLIRDKKNAELALLNSSN